MSSVDVQKKSQSIHAGRPSKLSFCVYPSYSCGNSSLRSRVIRPQRGLLSSVRLRPMLFFESKSYCAGIDLALNPKLNDSGSPRQSDSAVCLCSEPSRYRMLEGPHLPVFQICRSREDRYYRKSNSYCRVRLPSRCAIVRVGHSVCLSKNRQAGIEFPWCENLPFSSSLSAVNLTFFVHVRGGHTLQLKLYLR